MDIQEDTPSETVENADVARVDIQEDTPSEMPSRLDESAEFEGCDMGHVVHVGEIKQREMELVASSIRAVDDPTHGNIDTTACR